MAPSLRALLPWVMSIAPAVEAHQWPDIFPTPPEVLGFNSRMLNITPSVRLHVVDRPGLDPHLEPVLFLHGWLDSWRSFQRVMPLLGSERRLIAVDLRGFGQSSKPLDSPYDAPMFTGDVAAVLDALDIPRLHCLVGHSMGSIISWFLAGSQPCRVRNLVLIGSSPVALTPTNPALLAGARLSSAKHSTSYEFVKAFQYSTFFDVSTAGEWFLQTVVNQSMLVPIEIWKAASSGMFSVTETQARTLLPNISARTIVVHGVADHIFTEQNQRDLLAMLPAGAEYVEVQRAGHSVQWEEHGAREVARLLQGVLAASCRGSSVALGAGAREPAQERPWGWTLLYVGSPAALVACMLACACVTEHRWASGEGQVPLLAVSE